MTIQQAIFTQLANDFNVINNFSSIFFDTISIDKKTDYFVQIVLDNKYMGETMCQKTGDAGELLCQYSYVGDNFNTSRENLELFYIFIKNDFINHVNVYNIYNKDISNIIQVVGNNQMGNAQTGFTCLYQWERV